MLDREPYRFEFFQAVRLLARMAPSRQVIGRFSNPRDEVVRIGAHPKTAFPASEIQALDRRDDTPAAMRVNFMGLTGPLGILPLAYSELLLERLRNRDTAFADFLDLFNHRMISLFYQAWEKYRFFVPYERGERDRFSQHVLALLGLGTPGLQDRQDVPDDSLLFYSGLLSQHAPPRRVCGSCSRITSACLSRSTSLSAPGTPSSPMCSALSQRRTAIPSGWASARWSGMKSGTGNPGFASALAR